MDEPLLIAVGSTRRPKLDAVRDALDAVWPKLSANSGVATARYEIVGREVPSGVRETPLTRGDSMTGARNRAESLVKIAHEEKLPWRFFVGLEGGLDVVEENARRIVFLSSWAYVTDGAARGAFGQSGAIELPESLAREVLDRGISLSVAIDAFAARTGVRDNEGAWGVLSAGQITRRDSFRTAVINALAPFFNAAMYASPESRAKHGSA